MAALSGYKYRKSITLSRASGAVTDYQMKVLVGESSGATGEDVDCESHVQADFDDLRFTTSDGTTELDYWIEEITGTTPNQLATVWIEFDSIGTSATTFYMYYGNAGASSVSSGADTFITFDDFERGVNTDELGGIWTEAAGVAEISTDHAVSGTRCMKLVEDAGTSRAYMSKTAGTDYAIQFQVYKEDANRMFVFHGNGTERIYVRYNTTEVLDAYNGGYNSIDASVSADAWHKFEITDINFATTKFDFWVDGTKEGSDMDTLANAANNGLVYFQGYTVGDTYIDNFLIRKWDAVEPTFGSWGAEELAPSGAIFFGINF